MSAVLFALLLSAAPVEDEHEELRARLEEEKALYDSLKSERDELLTVLDTAERLFRGSLDRQRKLQKALAGLEARKAELLAQSQAASVARREREAELGPRLRVLDRLNRQSRVGRLLSASDFATLVRRERGVAALLEADLAAVDRLSRITRWQKLTLERLERLEQTSNAMLSSLSVEQQVAKQRKKQFEELVSQTTAEQRRVSRVVAELEREERQLSKFVGDLQSKDASGFRARKGHLPLPTPAGLIEVGFGKVVNPRFNTVTVQKGLDIRAALGAPVVSVGAGTVVFSGWLKGYGNLVIVDHGGNYHSLYAHLAHALVEKDNEVEEGEEIAKVGDTGSLKGAFLYFEIRKAGEAIDPLPWLDPEGTK